MSHKGTYGLEEGAFQTECLEKHLFIIISFDSSESSFKEMTEASLFEIFKNHILAFLNNQLVPVRNWVN